MNIFPNLSMHNKFEIQLIDSRTGQIKQECTAYNVVLNRYYTALKSLINLSSCVYINNILLGTGSGVPAATDTALFHYLTNKSATTGNMERDSAYENPFSFHVVKYTTFDESQANGDLTEIGLGENQSNVYTHAMFTDAEGNPITIHKSNVDRLSVTATVYLTVTFPEGVIPLPYSNFKSLPTNKEYSEQFVTMLTRYTPVLFLQALGISESSSYNLQPQTLSLDYAANCAKPGLTLSCASTYVSSTRRLQSYRVLATNGNLSKTWQAFAVHTPYCIIPLPNHNLFAPIDLTLEQVGDGTTTDFNFGIACLMTEGTKVYIDGTLVPANEYTFYGKDFNNRQAWISQHGTYLVDQTGEIQFATSSMGAYPVTTLPLMCAGDTSRANALTLYYDFKEPYTVNALKHEVNGNCSLYYSNDNVNWTLVTTQSAATDTVHTFTPITARYWKTYIASFANTQQLIRCVGAFDYMRPQLQFNTPPAANAIITIETKSEYPLKNSNWIIEQVTFDCTINKATG